MKMRRLILGEAAFQASRRARPGMLLRFGHQTSLDWVLFYVEPNAVELGLRSYQVIVAFVLPKRVAMATK